MSITPTSIRFVGNGRPTSPARGLRVNRQPSQKGIQRTNSKTVKEFLQQSNTENGLRDPKDLGASATRMQKSFGINVVG
jgi:hypothetical protein